ncbi:carbohydrate kinase [Halomicroarcula sp. F13]|uniref:Carbohydrate kinase n=1 Tax=Haloarcula rubra TaxID=2487747 RepID=A0AAW4PR67_9EURY|nr:carbohydrate kinase [Halomicroarcula rubra]MBX0323206.1 carbohydrate kinase [Halomicroarcula rubra]
MTSDPTVLVAGDTLVDFVPERPGPPGDAGGYRPKFGGSGANVALALDRIGVPPLFWTRLATDDFGAFLRSHLDDSAIPDSFVVTDPEARTTLAVVTHDADGDRSFTFYREGGADTRFQTGTVPDETLDAVSWVHTTGVTESVEPSRSATLELQQRASEHCTVSLDPNWRPEMWESHHEFRAVVRGSLEAVDVVKATPEDLAAAGFEHDDPERLARAVTDYGPHTVVLTMGDAGALCYGTDASPVQGVARHPGYDVDVVDTTGAGDAFLAAFIAALTNGVRDADDALSLANAAGAVATTQAGAVSALTGFEQIRRFHDEIPWAA